MFTHAPAANFKSRPDDNLFIQTCLLLHASSWLTPLSFTPALDQLPSLLPPSLPPAVRVKKACSPIMRKVWLQYCSYSPILRKPALLQRCLENGCSSVNAHASSVSPCSRQLVTSPSAAFSSPKSQKQLYIQFTSRVVLRVRWINATMSAPFPPTTHCAPTPASSPSHHAVMRSLVSASAHLNSCAQVFN